VVIIIKLSDEELIKAFNKAIELELNQFHNSEALM
jgi:hypothetical protein